jgi:hypothetical protein
VVFLLLLESTVLQKHLLGKVPEYLADILGFLGPKYVFTPYVKAALHEKGLLSNLNACGVNNVNSFFLNLMTILDQLVKLAGHHPKEKSWNRISEMKEEFLFPTHPGNSKGLENVPPQTCYKLAIQSLLRNEAQLIQEVARCENFKITSDMMENLDLHKNLMCGWKIKALFMSSS